MTVDVVVCVLTLMGFTFIMKNDILLFDEEYNLFEDQELYLTILGWLSLGIRPNIGDVWAGSTYDYRITDLTFSLSIDGHGFIHIYTKKENI